MKYQMTGSTLLLSRVVCSVIATIAYCGVIQCAVARIFFRDRSVLCFGLVTVREMVQRLGLNITGDIEKQQQEREQAVGPSGRVCCMDVSPLHLSKVTQSQQMQRACICFYSKTSRQYDSEGPKTVENSVRRGKSRKGYTTRDRYNPWGYAGRMVLGGTRLIRYCSNSCKLMLPSPTCSNRCMIMRIILPRKRLAEI